MNQNSNVSQNAIAGNSKEEGLDQGKKHCNYKGNRMIMRSKVYQFKTYDMWSMIRSPDSAKQLQNKNKQGKLLLVYCFHLQDWMTQFPLNVKKESLKRGGVSSQGELTQIEACGKAAQTKD